MATVRIEATQNDFTLSSVLIRQDLPTTWSLSNATMHHLEKNQVPWYFVKPAN